MIYEVAVVLNPDSGESGVKNLKDMMKELTTQFTGELIMNEDWGVRQFPKSAKYEMRGHYLYFMYKANTNMNSEMERRLRISDSVLKFLTVRLGPEKHQAKYVKNYVNPFAG